MKPLVLTSALVGLGSLGVWAWTRASEPPASEVRAAQLAWSERGEVRGPGPAPVDDFHPDNQPGADDRRPDPPAPAYGGRVIVHIDAMPPSLNYAIESSTTTRNILYEVHETLMRTDWETWEWLPDLAARRDVEDTLVLRDGTRLHGRVEEQDGAWLVTPVAKGNPLAEPRRVAKDDVESVEPATVYTYELREGVRWHPADGIDDQVLDARDVWFSFSLYRNPEVRCDEKRYQFDRIESCDIIDGRTVRFVYHGAYFRGDQAVGEMTILPSHLYDLTDRDNPDYDQGADTSPSAVARHVNQNPHNRMWVGLGPYRVVRVDSQVIEAERFDGYFDPAHGGYLDEIRWRVVPDASALQALLAGELDFTPRLSADDYFGPATDASAFTERFYEGFFHLGRYGCLIWNTHRPELADPRVRRALAHAVDLDGFRRTYHKGLARQVTGPMPFFSRGYDRDVKPFPYDPERASAMLADAGWYDRDGDGVIDKDGRALALELLLPAGSATSRTLGLKLQEDLARVGVRLKLSEIEWGTFRERQRKREFDVLPVGWSVPLEPDPEHLWHSRGGADGIESSNHSGLEDAGIDALIERGQRELDTERRMAIWRELHAALYELQPFLFLYDVPAKFALSRRIRGFQSFALEPGYALRRWYQPAGTPGTRATREPASER